MNAWQMIKRLFVVHKCAACRRILSLDGFDDALCEDCLQAYRVASTESCPECFKSARECLCQPKLLSDVGSLGLRKLYFYHTDKESEPQNRLIYFIKHHSSARAQSFIASELYKLVSEEIKELVGCDHYEQDELIVVNVPRGRKAKLEYGFDHAAFVSIDIAGLLKVEYLPVIKRRAGGKEQKKLNAAERRRNMKNILYADPKLSDTVKDKCVILFDDVVTTGASMEGCVKILRKLGAKAIICCCIATDIKKKKNS